MEQDRPNIHRNVHPSILALGHIVGIFLLEQFVSFPFVTPSVLRYAGFALVVIGFLLGANAFNEFRSACTTLDPHGSVKALVTGSMYRFTRNLIYLGFLLIVIGLPLFFGVYWGLLAAPLFVVTLNRLVIEKEETYLEKKFGEVYTGYRSRVRRWL